MRQEYKPPPILPILVMSAITDLFFLVGKTLAFTSVEFFNNKGQLAARGSHTK